jgi:hypothetical protein
MDHHIEERAEQSRHLEGNSQRLLPLDAPGVDDVGDWQEGD